MQGHSASPVEFYREDWSDQRQLPGIPIPVRICEKSKQTISNKGPLALSCVPLPQKFKKKGQIDIVFHKQICYYFISFDHSP